MLSNDELAIPNNPYIRTCSTPKCGGKYDDQDYWGRVLRFGRGMCDKCEAELTKTKKEVV